jgi:RHS repeat-associated protein
VPITVNAPPTVSLISPAQNATFTAPANITLTADAADADGTVTSVEFYQGSTLITTLTAAPYTFAWTNVPQGAYVLTAKATDDRGAVTTSAPVNITVGAAVGQLYFIHTDHLNTPRLVADSTGTTVWRWDQAEPFGNNPADENPSGLGAFDLPLRFPGQRYDAETGLHYNYFRDYDPSIGRYGESDPIGLYGGINLYAYVAGKPLLRTDPLGLLDPGGKGEGGGSGSQGGCKLLLQILLKPGLPLYYCIYLCEVLNQCPPKRWVEYEFSMWIWGCQDFRPAKGPKPGAGPD